MKNSTTNPKKASKVSKVAKHEFHAQISRLYIRGYLVFFGLICRYPKLVMKKKVKKAKVAREPNHNNLLVDLDQSQNDDNNDT
jgi:hypothetical protein